jgi:hypothetical protein
LIRRHRGVAVLVGLTVGSLAAAGLAWWVGYKIGLAQFDHVKTTADIGARLDAPLGLRVTDLDKDKLWPPLPTGVAAVQALVAAAIYTGFAGFSTSPDLGAVRPTPVHPWPGQTPGTAPVAGDPNPDDQFGPGLTGRSDNVAGTALT